MTVLAEPKATARDAAPRTRAERAALLEPLLAQRILVLDGAMGTMIQGYQLDEADFRGERFARPPARPARRQRPARRSPSPRSSAAIHDAYLEAGADIIETNTFNAQRASPRPTTASRRSSAR